MQPPQELPGTPKAPRRSTRIFRFAVAPAKLGTRGAAGQTEPALGSLSAMPVSVGHVPRHLHPCPLSPASLPPPQGPPCFQDGCDGSCWIAPKKRVPPPTSLCVQRRVATWGGAGGGCHRGVTICHSPLPSPLVYQGSREPRLGQETAG